MGNFFFRRIERTPDERAALKKHKKRVEQHSSVTGEAASNIEDAWIVDLDSGLERMESVWKKKDHICRWTDLKFGWELLQLKLFGFSKKEELVLDREGNPTDGFVEDSHPFKVDEDEVFHALYVGNSLEIVVTHEPSNIRITREVLQCLRPGAWLNDEVINLYLELLKERERREQGKFLTCHFFNTFFFKKLISGRNGYDFRAVRRWTAQEKLGYALSECDKVFVPIHKDIHWCLVVINVKDETFQYLDSLGGMDTHVLEVLERYFMEESRDKVAKEVDTSSWKRESVDGLPLQINAWDCGMFMLKYIDFYSRGLELSFNQEHVTFFRKAITKEILTLKAE